MPSYLTSSVYGTCRTTNGRGTTGPNHNNNVTLHDAPWRTGRECLARSSRSCRALVSPEHLGIEKRGNEILYVKAIAEKVLTRDKSALAMNERHKRRTWQRGNVDARAYISWWQRWCWWWVGERWATFPLKVQQQLHQLLMCTWWRTYWGPELPAVNCIPPARRGIGGNTPGPRHSRPASDQKLSASISTNTTVTTTTTTPASTTPGIKLTHPEGGVQRPERRVTAESGLVLKRREQGRDVTTRDVPSTAYLPVT